MSSVAAQDPSAVAGRFPNKYRVLKLKVWIVIACATSTLTERASAARVSGRDSEAEEALKVLLQDGAQHRGAVRGRGRRVVVTAAAAAAAAAGGFGIGV